MGMLSEALSEGQLTALLETLGQARREELLLRFYISRIYDRSWEEFLRESGTGETRRAAPADILGDSANILARCGREMKQNGTL